MQLTVPKIGMRFENAQCYSFQGIACSGAWLGTTEIGVCRDTISRMNLSLFAC